MFDSITINLDGPICSCDVRNLEWAMINTTNVPYRLEITCGTCHTKILVPEDKVVARFNLRRPYPAEIVKIEVNTEPERHLKVLDGGNQV